MTLRLLSPVRGRAWFVCRVFFGPTAPYTYRRPGRGAPVKLGRCGTGPVLGFFASFLRSRLRVGVPRTHIQGWY